MHYFCFREIILKRRPRSGEDAKRAVHVPALRQSRNIQSAEKGTQTEMSSQRVPVRFNLRFIFSLLPITQNLRFTSKYDL